MPFNTCDIIILHGAPGSGKSQTAKSLCRYFPQGVRLEVDTLRQMVISVNWTNQQEHIKLLEVAAEVGRRFLALNFKPVIIVDTFSGNKLDKFLKELQGKRKKTIVAKIVGLYCSDSELKHRLELRPENEFKNYEISVKLNTMTLKTNYNNQTNIDTTGLLPGQTAEIIYKSLTRNH